ncbi:glycosyltransferase family 2 protein [Streptococcus sp. NLN64]|uniref:glycosyltransferase family 2 protein n=1 Tax=Streptococcus sp. NLN64 TaxID=2822799 RepID=UPI0018CADA91|nr:glycosyltransferase family 2 protein [Streptococcus sp. NLN64]MBG9366681.1 glycosyltransferase [Streptococcus sp. NLN64]
MTQPVVSIICTVYNKAPWIEKTLTSFLEQKTSFTFEVLVIDDASTDSSWELIQKFQFQNKKNIRIFSNSVNQGIARTWVEICSKANGKYIARCDGDDFWLDPYKLQKQVDLLESNSDSAWSNTDFDIYDDKGKFVSSAGFESGVIPLADTYEKMLTTRGFTMASTWLVERDLILEINEGLDLTTADDTFNLQLELFKRTKLSYLPESTVAYVINTGSDSRPISFESQRVRFEKLLETQKEFVRKYPENITKNFVDLLLERNNEFELALSRASAGLEGIGFESVKVYFSDDSSGFSEVNSQSFALKAEASLEIDLPVGCRRIRIDLSERPSFYDKVSVELSDELTIEPSWTNGIAYEGGYFFINSDPQLIYDLPSQEDYRYFKLYYKGSQINNVETPDYLVKKLLVNFLECQNELRLVKETLNKIETENTIIKNSWRWKISTAVINFFRRKK